MKNKEEYLSDIKEIRQMMEQSSRFLSLSGLSGVLVGIYALISAFIAHKLIGSNSFSSYDSLYNNNLFYPLILLAVVTLIVSLVTVLFLTYNKTKKAGSKFWNPGSKQMMTNLLIPLVAGGLFILIFAIKGIHGIIAPSCLIFYGLALTNASKFTRQEIFYMGIFQIILGILAAIFIGFGLIFWALGFGAMHIIYGTVMYFRYEYKPKEA